MSANPAQGGAVDRHVNRPLLCILMTMLYSEEEEDGRFAVLKGTGGGVILRTVITVPQ